MASVRPRNKSERLRIILDSYFFVCRLENVEVGVVASLHESTPGDLGVHSCSSAFDNTTHRVLDNRDVDNTLLLVNSLF